MLHLVAEHNSPLSIPFQLSHAKNSKRVIDTLRAAAPLPRQQKPRTLLHASRAGRDYGLSARFDVRQPDGPPAVGVELNFGVKNLANGGIGVTGLARFSHARHEPK